MRNDVIISQAIDIAEIVLMLVLNTN